MPQGNRRGPEGKGPGTGRGMGFCSGEDQPGSENSAPGRKGGRRGGGTGRGMGGGGRRNSKPGFTGQRNSDPVRHGNPESQEEV